MWGAHSSYNTLEISIIDLKSRLIVSKFNVKVCNCNFSRISFTQFKFAESQQNSITKTSRTVVFSLSEVSVLMTKSWFFSLLYKIHQFNTYLYNDTSLIYKCVGKSPCKINQPLYLSYGKVSHMIDLNIYCTHTFHIYS